MNSPFIIEADKPHLDAIQLRLSGIKNGMGQVVARAANAVAKKVTVRMSRVVREHLPVPKATADRFIGIARARASDTDPTATVTLKKSARIPLQYFGAVQIGAARARGLVKRGKAKSPELKLLEQFGGGVKYNIGAKFVEGAFMGSEPGKIAPKLHGGVFIRSGYPGQKSRMPIRKLFGASPWGAFVVNDELQPTLLDARDEMDKELNRAAAFLLMRNAA